MLLGQAMSTDNEYLWFFYSTLLISLKTPVYIQKSSIFTIFFIHRRFETKQLSRIKNITNIRYQCSLPDPTPSASCLKINFQISDFDTYCAHFGTHQQGENVTRFSIIWQAESRGYFTCGRLGGVTIIKLHSCMRNLLQVLKHQLSPLMLHSGLKIGK